MKATRRHSRNRPQRLIHLSKCPGLDAPLRGTAEQLALKYAELGTHSKRMKDDTQAEMFFQHAHHFAVLHSEGQ